jgi:putative chitinase
MKQQADIQAKAEAEAKVAEERAEAKRLAAEQQRQLEAANAQAEAERRHARVLRFTLIAIVLLALGMGGVAVYAYRQKKVADQQKTVADQQTLKAQEEAKRAEEARKVANAATAEALASKGLAEENEAKALTANKNLTAEQKKTLAALVQARQAKAGQEEERSRREVAQARNLSLEEELARLRSAANPAAGNQTLNISAITNTTNVGPTSSASRVDAAALGRILGGPASAELAQQLQRAMEEFEINTPLRQAAFIAQMSVETAGFTHFVENLNYSAGRLRQVFPRQFPNDEIAQSYAHNPEKIGNLVYANRAGNGPEESGDGWRYRSRLFLFGRSRYREFGQALKLDLEKDPDQAGRPEFALRIAAAYWKSAGANELADQGNLAGVTRKLFGGTFAQTDREKVYLKAKEVLGVQ